MSGVWAGDDLLLRNSATLVYCEIRPPLIVHPILLWLAFLDKIIVLLDLTFIHCLRVAETLSNNEAWWIVWTSYSLYVELSSQLA